MELFRSLEKRTKLFSDPFKHFEINQPLTQNAIDEICNAEIADPRKQNLNYDGTRALDGGEGAFRAGIKDGGKAKKLRCYVTCLLYTSPSPRDRTRSRMPSSA